MEQELLTLLEHLSSPLVFNTTGITCGAGTANPTGAPEYHPWFLTRQVSHVEQELLTLLEHLSSPLVFNTTGITCGAGTANPTGAPEFTPGF